ncbi:MAG: ribonuclease D [Syntrophales bacterium]
MTDYIWIDTENAIGRTRKDIRITRLIALDTEYDSFRYFRERLCLLQIRTEARTYLFDPLANIDLSFLADCFADPDTTKIIHAGDNDIRLLKRDYGFEFKNIFDTQKAASMLGHHNLSLSSIIRQALGIELQKSKKLQRSRWDIRPLTEQQKAYAVQDIQYLIDLYKKFRVELAEKGLNRKATQVFEQAASVVWTERVLDQSGYLRIIGSRDLRRDQKTRLKNLFQWRFQKAKETDTAVFMILSDQNLIDLARCKIRTLEAMKKIARIPSGKITRFGPEIIDALKRTGKKAEIQVPADSLSGSG